MTRARHVMLDLETMGTSPDAAIVAIGAVTFEPADGTCPARYFQPVQLETAVAAGGTIDPGTVQWWMRQSDAARAVLQGGAPIVDALVGFAAWLADAADGDVQVWGNGADFDNVILSRAYTRARMARPWRTYANRCYRTAKNLRPEVPLHRIGVHHHAADDAASQAMHLMAIFRALGVKP